MTAHNATVVFTSTQMAKDLGINRSTLVRLEQRLIIPKAPLAPHGAPVQGRLYDADLVRAVRLAYAKHLQTKNFDQEGRPSPPKAFVVGERMPSNG